MLFFRFTVIGAGAVGLAAARALSQRYRGETDVLVIEKERSCGTGISSRSSEVIHSGLYYTTGSLKHTLCVAGRRALYQYCSEKNIPHSKCGKLVAAAGQSEEPQLDALFEQGCRNGIENIRLISRTEATGMEPDLSAAKALFVEETGIFDTHSFVRALESDVTRCNGTISYDAEVCAIGYQGGGYEIQLRSGESFTTGYVINAAGLGAPGIARLLGRDPVIMYPCKGSYFAYSGAHRVKHLVYPIPEKGLAGLGVHATIDLAGRLRFGPDAEYVDAADDFIVDEGKLETFKKAAQRLFPGIDCNKLLPDQAGIRPKIQGPGDEVKDFYIREETDQGFSGFVNLLGIESPGLTASLAIGEHVFSIVQS